MAEGVIVIPVFIIIWIGMYGVHSMYKARLTAQSKSSSLTLVSAQNGECKDQSVDLYATSQGSNAEKVTGNAQSFMQKMGSSNPLILTHAHDSASEEYKMFNKTKTIKGSRILACNTKPIDNLMDFIGDQIKSLLGL